MSPSASNSNSNNKETIETYGGFSQPFKPSGVLDEMMIPRDGRRPFFAQRRAADADTNHPKMDKSTTRPMSKSFSCPSLGSFSSSSSSLEAASDHGEFIEIVLRGSDMRDDNETRWVSSDEDEDEGEDHDDGGKVKEEDEGEADYEELLEPSSWEEEEDEGGEEDSDNHNYYDVDEDDDGLDGTNGGLITYDLSSLEEDDDGDVVSTDSGDDIHDDAGIHKMELSRKGHALQKYNELLEEDTLRLRRTYQWLQETLAEEQQAISVAKANHIMDTCQLKTQIDMLQEDKQILTEKVATLEATIIELTIKSTFHTNRISSLEDELQQQEQRKR